MTICKTHLESISNTLIIMILLSLNTFLCNIGSLPFDPKQTLRTPYIMFNGLLIVHSEFRNDSGVPIQNYGTPLVVKDAAKHLILTEL